MRSTKLLTLVSLLAVGLGKEVVAKEVADSRLYVAPSISYLRLDDDRQSSDHGFGANLGLGKAMNENINVELKATYNRANHEPHNSEFDAFGAGVDVQYYLNRNQLAPYFVAGVGLLASDIDGENFIGTTAEAGIGAALRINDNLSLRSDVRYRYNYNLNDGDGSSVGGHTSNYDDLIVNVGLVIPFGKGSQAYAGELDSDNDGVVDSRDKCPNTKPGVEVNSYGCNKGVNLVGVNFNYDSYALTPSAKEALNKVSQELIVAKKDKSLEIQGHTSSEGTDEYNMNLSKNRAESVVKYLTNKNVPNTMTAVGFGEERPEADNTTEEGRIQNRRVELVWE